MRTLLYFLISFSTLQFQGGRSYIAKWVIVNGCSLRIDGSTNINNFNCTITNYSSADTILVSRNNPQQLQLNGSVKLDIENFNCHNPMMTADFQKTLHAREFPKLVMRFISLTSYPEASKPEPIKGIVIIELAGRSRPYEIDYRVLTAESNFINMVGSKKVNFSDFNIEPPRKLGGMIRTNNELSVVFNLRMRVLN
jgi:hypothetical protein